MRFCVGKCSFTLKIKHLHHFNPCAHPCIRGVPGNGTTCGACFFLWITWSLCQNCPQLCALTDKTKLVYANFALLSANLTAIGTKSDLVAPSECCIRRHATVRWQKTPLFSWHETCALGGHCHFAKAPCLKLSMPALQISGSQALHRACCWPRFKVQCRQRWKKPPRLGAGGLSLAGVARKSHKIRHGCFDRTCNLPSGHWSLAPRVRRQVFLFIYGVPL